MPDILLKNFCLDYSTLAPNAQAVLIRDGLIHAIDSIHLLKKIATNSETIDLKGNILLPAFTDAHTHFVETAKHQLTLNVLGCQNDDEFYQRLVDYRETFLKNNDLAWIKGFGWEKRIVDNFSNINKQLIDKVFPDVPVSIASRDLHSNLLNTKALNKISPPYQSQSEFGTTIEGGGIEFGKFHSGEPNGFLYENSWTILEKVIPPIDNELLKKLVRELIKKSYRYGLCGVHSMENSKAAEIVKSVCEEEKFYFTWYYLNETLGTQASCLQNKTINDAGSGSLSFPVFPVADSPHFRNGGLKYFTDGSLGSDTAWMFSNEKSQSQKDIMNTLEEQVITAHLQGIQVSIHCIGDYAVYLTANMLKEINQKFGMKVKHRLEHLQAVRPEDIELLKQANIHASMQSIHIKEDAEVIQRKWLIARDYAFPLKSVSAVAEMALGSDAPVETLNPFEGIKYALLRDKMLNNSQSESESRHPVCNNNSLSLKQAIDAYTFKHHIIANKPTSYGLIQKGQIANLISIKKEIFQDIMSYNDITVDMIMIDGLVISNY